jgi:hypothetical protein
MDAPENSTDEESGSASCAGQNFKRAYLLFSQRYLLGIFLYVPDANQRELSRGYRAEDARDVDTWS